MSKQNLFAALDAEGKIYRPLDLGRFSELLQGQTVQVWVNLPRDKVRKLNSDDVNIEYEQFVGSLLYFQNDDGEMEGLTPNEITDLFSKSNGFCQWLKDQVWSLYKEYADGVEKKAKSSSGN